MKKELEFIRKYLKRKDRDPLIIAISGVRGSGKSTIALSLMNLLKIRNKLGVGPIIYSIRRVTKNKKLLKNLESWGKQLRLNKRLLREKPKIVCGVIEDIINESANTKGKDYIFEGTQILPQYLNLDNIFLYIFLKTPPLIKYKKRVSCCDGHFKRVLSYKKILYFKNVLEKELIKQIKKYKKAIPKSAAQKIIVLENRVYNKTLNNIIKIISFNIKKEDSDKKI